LAGKIIEKIPLHHKILNDINILSVVSDITLTPRQGNFDDLADASRRFATRRGPNPYRGSR